MKPVIVLLLVTQCFALKRNVLIIVADDLGLELSAYNNTDCKTPNIKRFAERSVTFRNAFTSVSSCSPSRSAILTGLPTHQNGMFGLHNGVHSFNSFKTVRSISRILKKRKIKTGIIGKKHVGPESVYPFDFEYTEDHNSMLQVGRNITRIKELVNKFFNETQSQFMLYIGFHDPHRCAHSHPQYGNFCEKFGSGEPGMGLIPDWKPTYYNPQDIKVPYWIPDTDEARQDIANYYTTISRVGLILKELENAGHNDDTLVIFTSDNGPSFPNGRTNLYDPAIREPFLLLNPSESQSWGKIEDASVSLLDIVPTVLDWYGIKYPNYKIFKKPVKLTGKSLLPFTVGTHVNEKETYFSHNLHEITMYYPMRSVRTEDYKLIHNMNFFAPFPIDQDFYLSPTFQGILNRTKKGEPLYWSKNLTSYYHRKEWELYDLKTDFQELNNIYGTIKTKEVVRDLKRRLLQWQNSTDDPWFCSPHAVLEKIGPSTDFTCSPLFN